VRRGSDGSYLLTAVKSITILLMALALGCAPAARIDRAAEEAAGPSDSSAGSSEAAAEFESPKQPAPSPNQIDSRSFSPPPTPWRTPSRATCPGRYSPPRVAGQLDEPALREASGLAASLRNPEILWIQGDSGELYALTEDGRSLGFLGLPGVRLFDLEDIAAAPCPDFRGSCLWLADTGDNNQRRPQVAIYAVLEPEVSSSRPLVHAKAEHIWRFPVAYPEGPIDSEALVVAPDLSSLFLFEKSATDRARVFELKSPFVEAEVGQMTQIAVVRSPGVPIPMGQMITGADLHPSGDRLLIRVYSGSFEYQLESSADLTALPELEPRMVALGPLTETQGEAIAYDGTGRGVWTVSERSTRSSVQPLHHYSCPSTSGR
jgi:hypothetical protein